MLDSVTKKRIDDLRNILVGKIPSPQSQVEQITTGLIYKFMYDMDEEAVEMGGVPSFFVGDYEKYSWKHLFDRQLGGADKVQLYSDAIENMYTNPSAPQLFREIFKNSFLPFKDPSTLNMFLKEINEFHYSHSEKLGDAFEYLLSFMGSQGDAGQFRTPRHIIDFIVEIVNPKKNETILDPACGTAGFLISSYKHILSQNTDKKLGDRLNASDRKQVGDNLVGYDISPDMTRISLVNMYLHQFASPQIHEYDTLSSEDRWNEYYDVILANPPFFSPTGGIQPHTRFGVQSTRAEVLFVDYIMEHLKPTGRAGIVVPEGIIFQTGNAYKTLRKKLIEDSLVGVISLPAGVFQPYSGVKTSILVLDKELNQKSDSIFFAKVENDGFSLGAQRTPIKSNDLPEIHDAIVNFSRNPAPQKISDTFYVKTKQEVLEKAGAPLSFILERNLEQTSQFELRQLQNLVEIRGGGTPSRKNNDYWEPGTIKWITCKHLDDKGEVVSHEKISNLGLSKSSSNLVPKDSTIVVTRVSVGKVSWADEEYAINQDLTGLTVKNEAELSSHYLFLVMQSLGEHIKDSAQGIGVTGVTRDFIKQLEIPVPPIEIQQQIVDEVEGYQKIIDGCRQVVEHYKPTIDIDPSWEMIELGEVCEFAYGKGLKESDRIEGEFDVFGSNGVVGSHSSFLVEHPFIVVGRKGSAGAVHYSTKNGFPIDTTFYISKKELKKSNISLPFLFYTLTSLGLDKTSSQQTVPGLNRNDAYRMKIPLPDLEIQEEIVRKIMDEQSLVSNNKKLLEIYTQKIQDRITKVWGE